MRHFYSKRRDCLIEALHHHFGSVRLSGLESGLHLAWHLPDDFPDAHRLQALALQHGVGIYAVSSSTAYDYGGCNYSERTLILGFSSVNEYQIRAGIQRIADALTDQPVSPSSSSEN